MRHDDDVNNLQQHYSNYLTRHSDVNIVCRQPVCHYAAPLTGGIKTNVTHTYYTHYVYNGYQLLYLSFGINTIMLPAAFIYFYHQQCI